MALFMSIIIALESYTKNLTLTLENGNTPTGKLIEVGNNKFMGLTNLGGSNNDGVIFEFDIKPIPIPRNLISN